MPLRNRCSVAFAILLAGVLISSAEQDITIIFRCDDYGDTSPSKVAALLYEVFEEQQVPLTLGVIPFNKHKQNPEQRAMNPFKVELMQRGSTNGIVDIALHGYTHSHRSPIERDSEFKGLPLAEQTQLIAAGVSNLEHITDYPIKTFIPPWHSFDTNTLLAMTQAGMTCLSTEFDTTPFAGITNNTLLNLQCLPAGCDVWNINTHIENARRSGDPAPILMVLLHDYDFKPSKSNKTLNRAFLTELISHIKKQSDVHIRSISEVLPNTKPYTIRHLIRLMHVQKQMQQNAWLTKLMLQKDPDMLLPQGVLSSPQHVKQIQLSMTRRLMMVVASLCSVILGLWLIKRFGPN